MILCIAYSLYCSVLHTYIETLLPLMLFSSFTGNVTHLKVCSGFLIYIMETQQTKVIRRVNMMSKTEERDGNCTSVQCCVYRVYDYSLLPLAKSWCSKLNFLRWFSDRMVKPRSNTITPWLNSIGHSMKLYRKMAKCVISILSSIYFIAEIDLGKDDDILQVFMDPTGDHVIISMRSETNYYLHRLAKSVKQLSKFHVSSTCKYKYVCILYLHI